MPRGGNALRQGSPPRRGLGFGGFIVAVLLPIAWICLCPPFTPPFKPASRSKAALKSTVAVLHAYVDKYKKVPLNIGLLRAFAAAYRLPLATYDTYGERIDYLRLDDQHFLLRSYGEDQIQNSLFNAPDIGIAHWGDVPDRPLTYDYPEQPRPDLYPASMLASAEAPGHNWIARVFVDQDNVARHLVVRHLSRTGLFMVAPHDAVEEFLWLPDGQRLVFTATASSRYRDGVYLWDLRDDTVANLVDVGGRGGLGPAAKDAPLWLALAGLSRRGGGPPVVYVYEHARHDGGLKGSEFFSRAALAAFVLPLTGKPRLANSDEFPASVLPVSLLRPPDLRAHTGGVGLLMQQQWLQLPFTGPLETGLLAWHTYAEANSSSPLYPYALWPLSDLYAQSFTELKAQGDTHASETMRSYATEIARALLNYPLAPSYLRGLTLDAYEDLMDGAALPYRFGRFTAATTPARGPASK